MTHELTINERQRHIANLKNIAKLMDGKFGIGLDPLVGLFVPVVGDVVTLSLAAYMILAAERLGVPKHKLREMVMYTILDGLVSFVPLFGDVADFFVRSHRRNWEIVREHIGDDSPLLPEKS